ncbi:hypothetical protein CGRA01v4_04967 [Colletotrichum graminicola]|nr:hypothetical protein CGRA01v4_04967 [Colletotrichum graminicola]
MTGPMAACLRTGALGLLFSECPPLSPHGSPHTVQDMVIRGRGSMWALRDTKLGAPSAVVVVVVVGRVSNREARCPFF